MASGNYDVVILDEANVAEMLGYFAPGALLDAVRERPEGVELVHHRAAAPATRSWPQPIS